MTEVDSGEGEMVMRARIGDRLIMAGVAVGDPKRVGVIAGMPHADGSPPYTVRWLDSGRETLVFPSVECHIVPSEDAPKPVS